MDVAGLAQHVLHTGLIKDLVQCMYMASIFQYPTFSGHLMVPLGPCYSRADRNPPAAGSTGLPNQAFSCCRIQNIAASALECWHKDARYYGFALVICGGVWVHPCSARTWHVHAGMCNALFDKCAACRHAWMVCCSHLMWGHICGSFGL